MMSKAVVISMILMMLTTFTRSQDTWHGATMGSALLYNPAFAGAYGEGIGRLSYQNHYPGRNLDLHSLSLTYDTYIEGLHGGVGLFISEDYLGGIINELSGGLAYSYHLKLSPGLFLNAGLSASLCHRGINAGKIILPDQIDALGGVSLPTSGLMDFRGRTVFDVSTGFILSSRLFSLAFAVDHLARPDFTGDRIADGRLPRRIYGGLNGNFSLGEKESTFIKPVVLFESGGGNWLTGAGAVAEMQALSANLIFATSASGDIDLNSGFSFKTGNFSVFYNYYFNLYSENKLLPVSLYHRAGVSFSLNNVDKRKIINAINFPKL
ncbi:MAG: PorP/SprF family type IX secretion system membrane protein [Bacteroidales bacterium]